MFVAHPALRGASLHRDSLFGIPALRSKLIRNVAFDYEQPSDNVAYL